MSERQPVLSAEEVAAYFDEVFPQMQGVFRVDEVSAMRAVVSQPIGDAHVRPGGTVSGPTMFGLADCAFYIAVMAMIGREALTVTTSTTINFLRKPPMADLVAEARILKLGKVLAVGDVLIRSVGSDDVVAQAALTYAIPPAK